MSKTNPEYISLYQFFKRFPDEVVAVKFYEEQRWPSGVRCPRCDGFDKVKSTRSPQPYHCGKCRKYFSVKVGTVMESSKIPLHKWLATTYLLTTARKSVSSCQVARELGITQKTAWFLLHRIRESCGGGKAMFSGGVEIDGTYIGGKEKNKHAGKRLKAGRGTVGKAAVVGIKSRDCGHVKAFPVETNDRQTLHGAIKRNVMTGADVYTDDWPAYRQLVRYNHAAVQHSAGEYARGMARSNGIESFWALLKRGYYGTFHHCSIKHLSKYVDEFAERQNTRGLLPMERFAHFVRLSVDKRLTYQDLIR